MKTVIMAGGKGTRISSINSEIPKAMIPISDKPILEYQLECLKKQGFKDITIIVGYLGEFIQNYFGDGSKASPITGKAFGVSIEYVVEKEPLGTAGALYLIKDKLRESKNNEDFLLINGDIIFDIDIARFYSAHKNNNGLVTLFTHPNNHPYDSGIIISDDNNKVENWLHKEDERLWYQNRVNAGIHIISNRIFDDRLGLFTELKKVDLDRDILKPLITTDSLFCYDSPEYVKDMGTPDRLYSVIDDIKNGKVQTRNLSNKQKAIFLDRDGTINKYVGFLYDINKFELLPKVAQTIKEINKSGYLVIVITNQPVVSRGEITFNELRVIHNKMETLLGDEGAYVDGIYLCPHHPHDGYEGEIKELKIECNCRKPKAGMLLQAAHDFNIDISKSWMVGDSETDAEAGKVAGCKTILLNDEHKLSDILKLIGI